MAIDEENEEIYAISFLLESLDGEYATLQDQMEHATLQATARGYLTLAATMQEITAHIIAYRLKMIGWGFATGLEGVNTEEIINDILDDGIKKLPSNYWKDLRLAADMARTYSKNREVPQA